VHVVALIAFHVRIPLRRQVRHASYTRTNTDNVLIRCTLADGSVGWGEGVPREYVTGESIDSDIALLRRSALADQLHPCRDLESAIEMAERLKLAAVPDDERGIGGNAARCALEVAVLDAFGRCFGEPLSAVTQRVSPELYRRSSHVRYSGAITSSSGLKLRLLAWAYRMYGFRQIKVKVGMPDQDDVGRLRSIRRRIGPNIRLRLDANEAWSAGLAADRIRRLEPFGIDSVEQPVPHRETSTLRTIRESVRTPIMLDESLCGMVDAERAVLDQLCDAFNLRLSKCGGFIPTLRLAQFARRHGIQFQLGCQVGESAILSAAGRHFATSVDGLTALEGSFDRHLVREPLSTRDLTFGRGGIAPALDGPGLGIAIDPAAMTKVIIREEQLIG
jgi:L-alanine-DL-glutamate epimerase-like enolase superfamily enzyme